MFEFRMVGEGLFEEGIVMMGLVYDWKNIVDYQVKPVSKREGFASLTILVKKKSGKKYYYYKCEHCKQYFIILSNY